MKSSIILALASVAAVSAAPNTPSRDQIRAVMSKRAAAANYSDADIIQYALTLEHLESTFYSQGLANFTSAQFTAAGFSNDTYGRVTQIGQHEAQHVTLLSGALTAAGATPVSACSYKFPYTDVKSFLALAQVLEGVGTSAYLGAAHYLTTPAYVTVAGSILTTEARHNTFLAQLLGSDPFATPEDTPQSPREVISLAGGFITGCPSGSAPTIMPFPALTATSTNATTGAKVSLSTSANMTGSVFCAFANGLGVQYSAYSNGSCTIPTMEAGATYVVLTSSNSSLTDDVTIAGPALLALPSYYSLDSANGTVTGPGITSPGVNGTLVNGTKPSNTSSGASPSSSTKASGATVAANVKYAGVLAGVMAFAAFLL